MQIISRPDDVAEALSSTALTVSRSDEPVGDAESLQARMARFSDGVGHLRRRALVQARLSGLGVLEEATALRIGPLVGAKANPFDVMPLARTVPVAVLAAALGVAEVDVGPVTSLTAALCDALAPSREARSPPDDIDHVARKLTTLLRPLGPVDDDVIATLSVLFQARDATAALIGATLLAAGVEPSGSVDQLVESVLRHEAPVQCTRRFAVADVVVGGTTLTKGSSVLVMLNAPQSRPGAEAATFGAGAHACPGSSPAREIARGFVSAVLAGGWRPVPEQPVTYEPRPNLRLPSRVMVQRS